MKLEPIQNLTILKPLQSIKPLSSKKVSILNIPSKAELFLLSTNLLYQAKRILDKEIKCKKGLSVDMYTYKAIEIMKITNEYQTKYIDNKEFKVIKNMFGINGLY